MDFEKARDTSRQLLELSGRCGARGHFGKAHRLLGEAASKTDPKQPGTHFDRALSIFKRRGTLIEPDKVKQEQAE